jgi:O-glycosyl hydrolase
MAGIGQQGNGKMALLLLAGLAAAANALTATVNTGQTFQTMDGFGFSQAFGRANDLYNLNSNQRQYALDLLFSPTKGAGMTILRNRIGSSSSDSILPNSPGSPNATPQYIALGTDSNQVWVTQQAVKYGVKTIYADAWSAPGFMKTNNDQANGGYLCGVTGANCASGNWTQAYANYLVKYIQDYAALGLDITHVGFLNEPDLKYVSLALARQPCNIDNTVGQHTPPCCRMESRLQTSSGCCIPPCKKQA